MLRMTPKTLFALALAGFTTQSFALYPNIDAMLQDFRPFAPAVSPQIDDVIIALDNLDAYPDARNAALLSLSPNVDGGLRAASDGAMPQIMDSIFDRLEAVTQPQSGVASGDVPPAPSHSAFTKVKGTLVKKSAVTDENPLFSDPDYASSANTETTTATTTATTTTASSTTTTTTTTSTAAEPAEPTEIEPANTASVETAQVEDKPQDLSCAYKINGAWIHFLGDIVRQNERDNIPGYNADVLGILIGRDLQICPRWTVGAAIGYQHADSTSKTLAGSYLETKRYQATLYSRYNWGTPWFAQGALTLAQNHYENERYIVVGPNIDVSANSKFWGWETNVHLESGYIWQCHHFRAVPKVIARYGHFDTHHYYEENAQDLDLYVNYENMSSLELGIGGKIEYRNEFDKAYVVPEIHAYGFHDFIRDAQDATANFIITPDFNFLTQGATPAANSIQVGTSLTVHSYKNTLVKFQYDYGARTDYHRHQVFIKVRHEWV